MGNRRSLPGGKAAGA